MQLHPLYWLAGLFEGEGTFMSGPPSHPNSPVARISMTDRDVVARAADLLERAVTSVTARKPHYKPPFVTQIRGAEAVDLMRSFRPVLGPTRQQQVDRVLAGWDSRRARSSSATERFAILEPTWDRPTNDDRAFSWLAGLLEGEGSFSKNCDGLGRCYPVISVNMCDAAVIHRAARILGTRTVLMREPERPEWRPTFEAKVAGGQGASWMLRLKSVMGQRRQDAIDAALRAYRPIRLVDPPTHCAVPGCFDAHRGRGLCHKHYMMWSRDRANGRDARIVPLR